jgi:SAM-dependent methyltransferase
MFDPRGPTLAELARQALSSTERGYDLLAPKFDRTPFRTPDAILAEVARELASGPAPRRGLDLCCGTGAGTAILAPLCRDGTVGVDVSRGMLAVARRALGGGAGLVRADAFALPFGAAFDVVLCLGALGHVPAAEETRFIEQVAGVLAPGGRFVFVTAYPPPVLSARFWLCHGFNAAMRVRNALVSPPFVMYYLTFLLPEVRHRLERAGLEVGERPLFPGGRAAHLRLVTARAPVSQRPEPED